MNSPVCVCDTWLRDWWSVPLTVATATDMLKFIMASEHKKSGLHEAKTEPAALKIMDRLFTSRCA